MIVALPGLFSYLFSFYTRPLLGPRYTDRVDRGVGDTEIKGWGYGDKGAGNGANEGGERG